MTFCDKAYPRKLAYKFLEELKAEFLTINRNELKQKKLRPYAFQKFGILISSLSSLYFNRYLLTINLCIIIIASYNQVFKIYKISLLCFTKFIFET
jgi:hypothetical protein